MISPQSALEDLRDRLRMNGIDADPARIATAILGIARLNDWTQHPERMAEWIERLALELVNAASHHP